MPGKRDFERAKGHASERGRTGFIGKDEKDLDLKGI